MKNPSCRLARLRIRILLLAFVAPMLAATSLQAGEIHDAAASGDLNRVKALLEADPALLESKDSDGNTPLISACWGPPANVPRVAVADFLIDKGANINARNTSGGSPVYFALRSVDLMQRFIAKGADVNVRAYLGLTPLHQAASMGRLDAAKLLIEHGADLNARGDWGTILQTLIYRTGDSSAEMVKLLLKSGAKLQPFSFGNTELHIAAVQGSTGMARLLVERGADVNAVNEYGHTPLYYAARHGHRRTADALIAAGARQSAIVEANYGTAPQLTAALQEGEAHLWFLGGSAPGTGYAVKTKGHLLLFDPPGIDESPEAGLANGLLNPREMAGQKISALITRMPRPGSGPSVSELARRFPSAEFVLSFKPTADDAGRGDLPPYRLAGANESLSVGDIKVHTIPAIHVPEMYRIFTGGEGLGYLVEVDGVKVFHAGLHASRNDPTQMDQYRKEIDFLKPFGPIDIAILPIKGRHLNIAYEPYLYLLDQLAPKAVYLIGDDLATEEHKKCVQVLRARHVPVAFPEGGIAVGERFHYLPDQASATPPPKTDALSLSGAYLGQPLPGEMPQVFARGIVSTDDQQHGAPTFSPDGNEVFWQTNRLDSEKKWHVSVMTARRVGDGWTPPEVSPYEGGPVFSPDGQRLYFDSKGEGDDPYFLEKQGDGWGEKKYVRIVSRFPELKFAYNLSITRSGTLYFLGYAAGLGLWNNYGIYRSELINGEYAKPELLPSSINAPGGILNWTPFVAPDESYLIFCSRRMTPKDDYGDLYVCFRQPDGRWTDRVSLGEPINSKVLERFPTVSPDGKYLFFTRWTPEHDEDVFWVSAGIIEQLKAKTVQDQGLKSGHRREDPK